MFLTVILLYHINIAGEHHTGSLYANGKKKKKQKKKKKKKKKKKEICSKFTIRSTERPHWHRCFFF